MPLAIRRSLPCVILVLLTMSATAEATNNTVATAWQTVLGEKRSQTLASGEVAYYGVFLQPWRSFAVFCWEPTLEDQRTVLGACQLEIRTGADAVFPSHGSGEPYPRSGSSLTFEPLAGFDAGGYFIRIVNVSATSQAVNFVIVETTLASPWFFVSPVTGYDSYVEVRNQSWAPTTVTVYANAVGGNEIPSTLTTLVLQANGTQAVSLRSLGVTGSGSLMITHNGMPGSVIANTTTLNAATGMAFGAPFTPRMVWSLF
jgi:hypothetical protein